VKLEPPPSAERRITDMFHASLVSHILVIIYSTYCLSAIEMYRGRAGKDKNLTQENRVCKIELIDLLSLSISAQIQISMTLLNSGRKKE